MGRQNVELFSMCTFERAGCYFIFLEWWGQYEVPSLLLVPMPLVLPKYSGMALQRSTKHQTCIWTVSLTEYVFMAAVDARYHR